MQSCLSLFPVNELMVESDAMNERETKTVEFHFDTCITKSFIRRQLFNLLLKKNHSLKSVSVAYIVLTYKDSYSGKKN